MGDLDAVFAKPCFLGRLNGDRHFLVKDALQLSARKSSKLLEITRENLTF